MVKVRRWYLIYYCLSLYAGADRVAPTKTSAVTLRLVVCSLLVSTKVD